MKIGILTLPLIHNYGGILQAYALKEVLQDLGHEVIVIDRRSRQFSFPRKIASVLKSKLIGRKINPQTFLGEEEKRVILKNTQFFIQKYIPNISHRITSDKGMMELNKMGFDAYVVGSDQCWRPFFCASITNNFLDFAEQQSKIIRIAYAASFGVTDWVFTKKETERCAQLAQKFDAISVREGSGIKLADKYLGVKAIHLIDPTMLLSKENYLQIVEKENIPVSEGKLYTYVLDQSAEKIKYVSFIQKELGLKPFKVLPDKDFNVTKVENINEFIYPSPAKWLRGFYDASFVVTDSFHGTVFSILFNIPFITIGNKKRGMTRFESLLKMFDLENRLISDIDNANMRQMVSDEINWNNVNNKLNDEREKAMSFLTDNLSIV